ncbi:MAG: DUF1801 domain-containing protein [Thermoflexales bacterium]|nr:DUF1801 domain-containing protein [Thermoflexales bacterium]
MAENKTKPTTASVRAKVAAIANDAQRKDVLTLIGLLGGITGEKPRLWGPSIIGFGSYHYRYASGHEGDSCLTGLAARGSKIVVYLAQDVPGQAALLARLGKHEMGKACLYFRRLSDIDLGVLEALVRDSVAELQRRYPAAG